MGKYALFLGQLLKTCSIDDTETREMLQQAEDIVSFQLRHGNDLLAMDLIRHADVNLRVSLGGNSFQNHNYHSQEQGSLLRQDDFVVFEKRGLQRHRCYRRVFLFEKLVGTHELHTP
jgi:hypothetical protein